MTDPMIIKPSKPYQWKVPKSTKVTNPLLNSSRNSVPRQEILVGSPFSVLAKGRDPEVVSDGSTAGFAPHVGQGAEGKRQREGRLGEVEGAGGGGDEFCMVDKDRVRKWVTLCERTSSVSDGGC